MFTSIIKELLGTKIAECCQTLIDESSNIIIALNSQKELGSIYGSINVTHTRYTL